jgi:hypothetical protein
VEYEGDGLIGFRPKGAPALWLSEGESRGLTKQAKPLFLIANQKERCKS